MKYANDQLGNYVPEKQLPPDFVIPKWNNDEYKLLDYENYIEELESRGIFFSSPMDLDYAMLVSFPAAYEFDEADSVLPKVSKIKAVLGDSYNGVEQYTELERKLFFTYHKRFKLGSKPAAHINALSKLTDAQLLAGMPPSLGRLADAAIANLAELPE